MVILRLEVFTIVEGMSALPPKADIKTWRPVLSLSLSVTLTAVSN